MSSNAALKLDNITRSFFQGQARIDVLKGLSLSIAPGEIVGLVGPSGAGKSTLLQIAGLLEHPDGGQVVIDGVPVSQTSDAARTQIRCHKIGFVYQFHHLLPDFTALENLILPQIIAGVRKKEAALRAGDMLARVGLSHRVHHHPAELSGGEQQRVAIMRALVNDPAVLLADEPTGNLDPKTAEGVFSVLLETVRQNRLGALIATHNHDLAGKMDRVLEIKDGLVRTV